MSTRLLWSSLVGVALALLAGCGSSPPPTSGAEPVVRLLSESQYREIIADVFGEQIVVGGTFDPLVRTNGLLTVGASKAHITPAGLEQFDRMARSIAAQVVNDDNRDVLVPCTPARADAADADCATKFFDAGRPAALPAPALARRAEGPGGDRGRGGTQLGDFYDGLAAGLAGMLVSPSFLFVIDSTEPDPAAPGKLRLDAYSKAARLSFFLWGTTPDDALLTAAQRGELHDRKGLEAQVERMVESPRLETGMRVFFNDMLAFEDLDRLEKDSMIYPAFSAAVARTRASRRCARSSTCWSRRRATIATSSRPARPSSAARSGASIASRWNVPTAAGCPTSSRRTIRVPA